MQSRMGDEGATEQEPIVSLQQADDSVIGLLCNQSVNESKLMRQNDIVAS